MSPSLPIAIPPGETALLQETGRPPQNAHDAAVDFEALLIAQMLKSARGEGGWLGSGDDSTASNAIEFAEQQLAALLAQQGGLGLANLLTQGLVSREAAQVSASQAPAVG